MKSAANGGLNLSVLDGWWVEGYDGRNGWEIDGRPGRRGSAAQDARHAHGLYDLLEQQVDPALPRPRRATASRAGGSRWCARRSTTNGPQFSAARMVTEYADRIYPVRERDSAERNRRLIPASGRAHPEGVWLRRREHLSRSRPPVPFTATAPMRAPRPPSRAAAGAARSTTSSAREPGARPEDGVERAGHVPNAAEHERRDGAIV